MASRGWGLVPKTILPTIVISAVIASAVGIVLYLDEEASVIAKSRKTAIAIAQQTLAERQVYAANVVNPLLRDFGGPDQGFATGNNTIRWVASTMHNPKDKGSLPLDLFVEEIPFRETRGYVKRVLRSYAAYRLLYGKPSERLLALSQKLPVVQ